ncbi:MAG: Eco57I restriction-modification methylase domain-containing protein [Balneolales bacterium]
MIQPLKSELPSQYADRLGVSYAASMSQEHKKKHGQFFTPVQIARRMAAYSECNRNSIRVLDPGCGSGILSCALLEYLVSTNDSLTYIELVVYETDPSILMVTQQAFDYLKRWVEALGINITITIFTDDFIMHNADLFINDNLFADAGQPFDIIISNPPYFKLPIDDHRVKAAKVVVNGHPNIYSIFMALSAMLLKENGELIFITPRSYAAGGYFKTFREYFFGLIDLQKVHLFVSRKETFKRDKVLQEIVIIMGSRRKSLPGSMVEIASSSGLKDIASPFIKAFPKKDIIDLGSPGKILYLPTSDFEEAVLDIFKSWSGSLAKYNIKISTGPVVAFRATEYVKNNYENGRVNTAPLFWLHNIKQMNLEWPIIKPKKGQYILIEKKSIPLLILNKNYVFLRRFSSKDDKNRLIAAPYFCNHIRSNYLGVENKVNYIYRPRGNLLRNEVVGLCALLNSHLFDSYFRIFNGNVNVSATELRGMPLPSLGTIKEIGDRVILSNDSSVESSNLIINDYFEPKFIE